MADAAITNPNTDLTQPSLANSADRPCNTIFSPATYNLLLALIVPLGLTLIVMGYAGKSVCQDYAMQLGPHSSTGAFLSQMCGAPGNGNLIPGIQSASLTVIPKATEDLHHTNAVNTAMAGVLNSSMQDARIMFNQTRNAFSDTVGELYAVMMNIVIQLVRMGLKTRDIAGKMGGATAALANATQGAQLTGESVINGPIVAVMKTLASA
jgi:hypothetical protein